MAEPYEPNDPRLREPGKVTVSGTFGPPTFLHLIPWKSAADPKGIDTGKEYLVRWPDGKVRQGEWYPFWRLWIDQLGDSFHPQPKWYVGMEELPGPGGDK